MIIERTGRLSGRRAFITGGASGIGAGVAVRFAAEGARVAIVDLESQRSLGEAVADRLGDSARFIAADVRNRAELDRAAAEARAALGGIDAIVAAAGVSPLSSLLDATEEEWRRVMDVNVTGVLFTIQSTLADLRRTPGATIVTIASVGAKRPGAGAYSVSKAAVWMLTRDVADSLAHEGIRVNAIGPGFIDTPMLDRSRDMAGADWYDSLPGRIPMGRLGTPDDVAKLAVFLTSDESSYITGSIIHPDGGWVNRHSGG